MKVINIDLNTPIDSVQDLAMCIGYFDGLHRGHQTLIQGAINFAKTNKIKSGLMTFNPDPVTVVRGGMEFKKHLYRMEDRIEIGEQLGLDYWFILNFTIEMSKLSPFDFVETILGQLPIKYIACGTDFRFGSMGKGSPKLLAEYGKNKFIVDEKPLLMIEGEKVSSTRITNLLMDGKLEEVTKLLGRPYHLQGPVIGGNRQGQRIGFPTANLYIDDEYVLPKQGVYIGVALVEEMLHPVMINIGHNLTFNTRIHLSVEGNILDFHQMIYGEVVRYYFLKFLRNELKFDSVDELVARMRIDEKETRAYLEGKDLSLLVKMVQ